MPEVPNHVSSFTPFRLVNSNPEPCLKGFSCIEMLLDLVQFVKRCFLEIVCRETIHALHKLPSCFCGAIRSCSSMHCDAALQTEVVIESVDRHHRLPVGKVTQPVGQRACSNQRLAVKHRFHIKVEEMFEFLFRARSSCFFNQFPAS